MHICKCLILIYTLFLVLKISGSVSKKNSIGNKKLRLWHSYIKNNNNKTLKINNIVYLTVRGGPKRNFSRPIFCIFYLNRKYILYKRVIYVHAVKKFEKRTFFNFRTTFRDDECPPKNIFKICTFIVGTTIFILILYQIQQSQKLSLKGADVIYFVIPKIMLW